MMFIRYRKSAFLYIEKMIRRVDTECHGTIVRKGTDAFSEQMNKAVIRWCGQRKSRKVFHVVR